MSEAARSSVLTGGFKIFWWSLVGGWLCLPLAFALLTLEKWTTGVDRSWAAMHGAHPAFLLFMPWMLAWPFTHVWLVSAALAFWRSRRPSWSDLLRYFLLLAPTATMDLGLILGWH